MNKRWLKLAAVPIALSLVAAACGSDDDASGSEDTTAPVATEAEAEEPAVEGKTEITVTGPERDESEAGSIQAAFDVWGDANGVAVTYIGDADWEANVNTQVEGGNP
ncbi:MAG: alpha-glucoside transport system substrate-binding protein, partial [Halioglobus sp.]